MKKSLTQIEITKSSKKNKSKKKKQKCVNAFNDYYYDHFLELSQKAAAQRQIYSQIIPLRNIAVSIKKYPFPILSLEQASSLQGIGDHYIGKFKKLINDYKIEIKEKNLDYINLAYSVKPELGESNLKKKRERSQQSEELKNSKKVISFSNPGTKKATQLKEIKAEAKKLKFKNNLININLYSSLWTTAVCCYVAFFNKESYDIDYSNIKELGNILKSKFKEYNIIIEKPNIDENRKDIEELKNLKLIDSIKKNTIIINDYLIKLVKIELDKIGFSIKKNEINGILEYTKLERNNQFKEDSNNIIKNCNNIDYNENDKVKNILLEEYIEFMRLPSNDNINNNINSFEAINNEVEQKENIIKSKFSDNIYLIVDLREKGAGNENFRVEILNKLPSPIPIEEKNLSLGDFTWIYKDQLDGEEYMIDFIIERKTLNDLSASILDGRYNEQKYRLKNSPYKNIYYLFEGTELNTHSNANISKDAINTAINNTINIHDIKFYRTFSTKDTVDKLIEIDSNIRKNFVFLKDSDGKKMNYKKYIEIFAKTKNSTVEEIFLRQLRCFEHCGKKCVEILSNCFQTQLSFYQLIQGLKEQKVNEKEMENIIAICYYLEENKKEINISNVLKCLGNIEEIEKFKKETFFSKILRKLAVIEMLNYYSFYDNNNVTNENITSEVEINNIKKNKNDVKNEDIEEGEKKSVKKAKKIKNDEKKKSPRSNSKDIKGKKIKKNNYNNNNLSDISDLYNDLINNDENKEKKSKKRKSKERKSKENKRKKKNKLSKVYYDNKEVKQKNNEIEKEIKSNFNSNENIDSFKSLENIGKDEDL